MKASAPRRRVRGFTVTEMVITISIMTILASIAVPSFRNATLASQLRASANSLLAGTRLARSEAIKRNATVAMCPSSDGSSCAAGTWEQGWIITSGGTVLFAQPAATRGVSITEASGLTTLSFPAFGAGVTSASFTVCRKTPTAGREERVLNLNATGRATISRTTAGACA